MGAGNYATSGRGENWVERGLEFCVPVTDQETAGCLPAAAPPVRLVKITGRRGARAIWASRSATRQALAAQVRAGGLQTFLQDAVIGGDPRVRT